jgi:hypothetical protein
MLRERQWTQQMQGRSQLVIVQWRWAVRSTAHRRRDVVHQNRFPPTRAMCPHRTALHCQKERATDGNAQTAMRSREEEQQQRGHQKPRKLPPTRAWPSLVRCAVFHCFASCRPVPSNRRRNADGSLHFCRSVHRIVRVVQRSRYASRIARRDDGRACTRIAR